MTVNDNTWVPMTLGVSCSTVVGAFANTCGLPDAALKWAKNDSSPTGAVNEAESIQPKDTGLYYRQVDCKYIYDLDVSSFKGPGTYHVYANIGCITLSAPAVFDLR